MKHSKKSQVAMEYLALIAFVMIVLGVISYIYFNKSSEVKDSLTNSQIDTISDEIDKAVNTLYSYGEGSQSLVKVNFPQNVESVKVEGRDLVFTVKNQKGGISEIAKSFAFDIKLGSVMTKMPGEKTFVVKSLGENQVFIGEKNSLDYLRTNVVGLWHLDDDTNLILNEVNNNPGNFNLESNPTPNFCTGKIAGYYCDGNDRVYCRGDGIEEEDRSDCSVEQKRCYSDGCNVVCRDAGKIGKSCNFNGQIDYIDLGNRPELEGLSEITISAWIYITPTTSYGAKAIVSKESVFKLDLDVQSDYRKIRFLTGNNWVDKLLYSSTSLNNNVWYHIVAVYDGNIKSIYINGVKEPNTMSVTGNIGTSSEPAGIGAYHYTTWNDKFVGKIDEVIIFKDALSESDIKTLYSQQSNGYGLDYY